MRRGFVMQNTSVTTFQSPELPTSNSDGTARGGLRGLMLVYGFGTALATWVVSYIGRMPGMVGTAEDGSHFAVIPAPVLFGLLVFCVLGGGFLAARKTGKLTAGVWTGLLASLLNLIILSSLAGGKTPAEAIAPEAVPWLAGFVLLGALLGAIGGLGGAKARKDATPWVPADQLPAFARVAALTVLLMLGAGGLVTSARAGLAVPDWPNSEGYFMVFYPLSHMTGGKFFEHAHRLYGVLTGLTTAVLGFWILARDPRRSMKAIAVFAMLLVIVQAVLGGLRVTGNFTLSQDAADLTPSLTLAVVHGVTGQLFFVLIVGIAAALTTSFRRTEGENAPVIIQDVGAATDRTLIKWLWAAVLLQVVLGAVLRHFGSGKGMLHTHITIGILVGGFAQFVGIRFGAVYKDRARGLSKLGKGLSHVVWTQILLGFVAWGVGGGAGTVQNPQPSAVTLVFATIHQLIGALVFAWVTLLVVWGHRQLRKPSPGSGSPEATPPQPATPAQP